MTDERMDTDRKGLLRRALRLEWLTVGWNAVEGIIAVAAALAAGSVALLGFGIDSFVETVSGAVILWRIGAERRARDAERINRVEGIARERGGPQPLVAGPLRGCGRHRCPGQR